MWVWRRAAWMTVIAVGGLLVGCASEKPETQQFRLIRGRPFERDIPVPAGFSLVEQASEDRSTGTTRLYLRHVYTGDADKYAVRNFYREQMPLAQWTKVSDGNIKGDVTMRYEKGNESCTVTITDEMKTLRTKTRVQVVIAREERGQTPPKSRTGS